MPSSIKKIISIAAILCILVAAYVGSWLPLKKSRSFIYTLQNAGTIQSPQDLEERFSVPLDQYSPIGQEELVRNIANNIFGTVNNLQDPAIVRELMSYLEKYYKPIIDSGRGMSFTQNLYVLGALNELAAVKTQDVSFLNTADQYFKKGNELSPKRPQFLYGLLDIARIGGRNEDARALAEQILSQWPDDTTAQGVLKSLSQ